MNSKKQLVKTLETNGTYQFVMGNIETILKQELEPRRESIENDQIDLGAVVEDLRQKVMLYLNDLFMKKVLKDIPAFQIAYTKGKSVFIEINPESFCKACGMSEGKMPIYNSEKISVH